MHTLTNPLPGEVKSSPELENSQLASSYFLAAWFQKSNLEQFCGEHTHQTTRTNPQGSLWSTVKQQSGRQDNIILLASFWILIWFWAGWFSLFTDSRWSIFNKICRRSYCHLVLYELLLVLSPMKWWDHKERESMLHINFYLQFRMYLFLFE